MATPLVSRPTKGTELIPWTPEALDRAIASDFLNGEAHYEIIGGTLYSKLGLSWPHRFAVDALVLAFRLIDLTRYHYSVQMSLRIDLEAPEPDFQVIRGTLRSRRSFPGGG